MEPGNHVSQPSETPGASSEVWPSPPQGPIHPMMRVRPRATPAALRVSAHDLYNLEQRLRKPACWSSRRLTLAVLSNEPGSRILECVQEGIGIHHREDRAMLHMKEEAEAKNGGRRISWRKVRRENDKAQFRTAADGACPPEPARAMICWLISWRAFGTGNSRGEHEGRS